jgi:hypothetical protein
MILERKRTKTVTLVKGFTKSNGTVVEEYVREYPRHHASPKLRLRLVPKRPLGHDVLTPWFPGGVKPARKGVYQRRMHTGVAYSYWTGRHWGLYTGEPVVEERRSAIQECEWRGMR